MREVLIEIALVLVDGILLALIPMGMTALVQWLRARGVNVSAKQEERLFAIAPVVAAGVEEYTKNVAKHGLRLESNEKLDQAVRMARKLAADGLKGVTEERLRLAIEASIPSVRAKLGQTSAMPMFRVVGPTREE